MDSHENVKYKYTKMGILMKWKLNAWNTFSEEEIRFFCKMK